MAEKISFDEEGKKFYVISGNKNLEQEQIVQRRKKMDH